MRAHAHSIYAKLGVHSRLAAVGATRTAGLLPRRPVLPPNVVGNLIPEVDPNGGNTAYCQ
ncbi:hypothetical protein ACOBQX_10625 [Actinokineospora sp. G85]|uniref:hypothetical protein n=1 Tax=Actinokineospora sp. G85 TaxID=3406626 RepID=UPI003C769473